jgi:hypothetical protein
LRAARRLKRARRQRCGKQGRLAVGIHDGAAYARLMQTLQSVTCFLPCAGVYTSGADALNTSLPIFLPFAAAYRE